MKGKFRILAALGAIPLCAVLATVGIARAGVSDAWISAKIKMALMNSPEVSGFPIDVDTDDGRVTIHGRVPTLSEKKEAERIAKAGTGVRSVRSLLQVVPDSRLKRVQVEDARIQDDLTKALGDEPALKNSSIHVKSVTNGVVVLDGTAASLSDHLLAMEVAASGAGVRRVATEIQSPDEFGDREIYDDPDPGMPTGNVVTDGWITAQTKLKFMTDAQVPASDINVDTRRGVVTLFGTVPTTDAADQAKRLAKSVAGVKTVNSELKLVPPSKKKAATANDGDLKAAVRQRLDDAKFEGADIDVDVKAATARLSGTVKRASDRYAAISLAHGTPGVTHVINDLRVESEQTSQR